jgi:hypothetical protein
MEEKKNEVKTHGGKIGPLNLVFDTNNQEKMGK